MNAADAAHDVGEAIARRIARFAMHVVRPGQVTTLMNRNPFFPSRSLWVLVLGLASVGCSQAPATVSGDVTLDGQPLASGTVVFQPTGGGATAYGTINDGEYTVMTGADEGLAPGAYAVLVSSTAAATQETERTAGGVVQEKAPELLTPAKYADPAATPLRAQVEPGANRIDLELTST